jgi:hypothetical protein
MVFIVTFFNFIVTDPSYLLYTTELLCSRCVSLCNCNTVQQNKDLETFAIRFVVTYSTDTVQRVAHSRFDCNGAGF